MDPKKIDPVVNNLIDKINSAHDLNELEAVEVSVLGRKGTVNEWLRVLKGVKDSEEKKKLGSTINTTKGRITRAIEVKRRELLQRTNDTMDPTLPGQQVPVGSIHPVSRTIEEIVDIFTKIGFYKVSYHEIEYEYFAFDSLNMPSTHPARDEFESFAVDGPPSEKFGRMVLSPHTSSGQVREMWRRKKPPIRMINVARCFRRNWDVTHTPMFHQFEGLCVDKGINITHLKGAIDFFAKEYFGYDVKIRLRPYHFQFTEPSFEVDTTCTICRGTMRVNGEKCRVCKSGWLELGGAGMVHPYVLREGKIDPDRYSGWAFGFGVERVYMMKYQLSDLRKLFSGELGLFPEINR